MKSATLKSSASFVASAEVGHLLCASLIIIVFSSLPRLVDSRVADEGAASTATTTVGSRFLRSGRRLIMNGAVADDDGADSASLTTTFCSFFRVRIATGIKILVRPTFLEMQRCPSLGRRRSIFFWGSSPCAVFFQRYKGFSRIPCKQK